ncbi:MAG: glycoside hydrolase family 9 protein, partial [Bacteroidales bacterium]
KLLCTGAILLLITGNLAATRLLDIQAVDNQCLVLHFQDGFVEYNWDDTISGSCGGWDYYHTEDWWLCNDKDQYVAYGAPLDTAISHKAVSFTIRSDRDGNYGPAGSHPLAVYRKSKVWEASIDDQMPAMHHWIYLELPYPLERGEKYTLEIAPGNNSDITERSILFDEYNIVSPAIKISNAGYALRAPWKSADVYMWMGDGGERDFSRLTGTTWRLFDVDKWQDVCTGALRFRMENRIEAGFEKDFTKADVWECDFSDVTTPGNYRLVIDGIGCSRPFPITPNLFSEPLKVAMQGMFYQRMGCTEPPAGGFPKSRRPLFRQGVDPDDFTVYISKKEMITGTNPDNRDWYARELTGETAKSTWGGWSDAYDNDQRPVNFICVFDLLLTYYLAPEAFTDGQLYIPETGNGIPDIIDEALWEIDWWLRMRDKQGGYLTGLTNIRPPENINYAGAPCAWQGWCVAAACAMAADCFRLNGNKALQERYAEQASLAFQWAEQQSDQMADTDVSGLRGRDLKLTAATYLFNITGKQKYEKLIMEECEVDDTTTFLRNTGNWEQQYAAVGYILSPQQVRYDELQSDMKAALMYQAKSDHIDKMKDSPTMAARYRNGWEGMCQTSNEMSVVALAHRLSDDPHEKAMLEKGLYAEAEWTLGRNPLGLVQMTGLTDHSFTQTFAPGRRDGYPGVTPGWTPYMCRDGWGNDDHIVRCAWYTNRNYPADKEVWPWGEHFWNSRYSVPNSETTPQQTFRQKIVLYGYLYALGCSVE